MRFGMSVPRCSRIWMLPVFLGCIGSTLAFASEPSASAFGVQVAMTLDAQPPSNVGPLASSSTAGPTSATVATATTVPGILTASTLVTVADLNAGSDTASASSTNVTLPVLSMLGPVNALNMQASCSAATGAITGSATFTNFTLGSLGVIGEHQPIDTIAPISIPAVGQIGTLTLNEQVSNPDGSLTVNALHVHLTGPYTGEGDVVVSSVTCGAGAIFLDGFDGPTPATAACEARANDSPDKLVECMRNYDLWQHLVAFQQIADANPGPDGHPSRTLGEPGYLASVNYVAGLMQAAGYNVTIQQYTFPYANFTATPSFDEVSPTANSYVLKTDWNPATYSGSGDVTATVQPVGGIVIPASPDPSSASGCSSSDFAGFTPGNIALIQRGTCTAADKVANAQAAGAVGVIIFNEGNPGRTATQEWVYLDGYNPPSIPVALSSYAVGADLYSQAQSGNPVAHLDISTVLDPARTDYNLIADSPYGDPNHVVVLDAHLDAIYGAGILDNASGSSTILEVALKMAHTPTTNQLRYIWFGGEELGIYGSQYYTQALATADAQKIVFDLDADVTATPNFVTLIADPTNSRDAANFPPNVVPASQVGNNYFEAYFLGNALPYAWSSNDGTDSWSFSWIGVPNSGILTGQDCCKAQWEADYFGGYTGNFEGHIPSFDGGFVDRAFLWGDNIDNNNVDVLQATSKAYAHVAWKLANDATLTSSQSAPLGPYRAPTARHLPKRGTDR